MKFGDLESNLLTRLLRAQRTDLRDTATKPPFYWLSVASLNCFLLSERQQLAPFFVTDMQSIVIAIFLSNQKNGGIYKLRGIDMKDQTHQNSYGLPSTGFIREKQLVPLLPFNRGTLLNLTAAGEFPPKYKLSKGIVAWSCTEVIEWLNAKTQREVQV